MNQAEFFLVGSRGGVFGLAALARRHEARKGPVPQEPHVLLS
jgi:hypothetical protein